MEETLKIIGIVLLAILIVAFILDFFGRRFALRQSQKGIRNEKSIL